MINTTNLSVRADQFQFGTFVMFEAGEFGPDEVVTRNVQSL